MLAGICGMILPSIWCVLPSKSRSCFIFCLLFNASKGDTFGHENKNKEHYDPDQRNHINIIKKYRLAFEASGSALQYFM